MALLRSGRIRDRVPRQPIATRARAPPARPRGQDRLERGQLHLVPKVQLWANGDGQLVYPAEEAGAFLPSVRLAATLDAMEDAELLRMLPAERRAALAARVVRNATHFNDGDPAAFEAARRAAAAEVVASLKFTW